MNVNIESIGLLNITSPFLFFSFFLFFVVVDGVVVVVAGLLYLVYGFE